MHAFGRHQVQAIVASIVPSTLRIQAVWALGVLATAAFWPEGVQAAPIYTGQSRQVAAFAGPNGSPGNSDQRDSFGLGGLGPWLETATTSYSDFSGNTLASATATQDSVIDAVGIDMVSSLSASASLGNVGVAQSILNVSFTLNEATPYVSQVMGTPSFFSFANSSSTFDVNSSGILPIGNYSLQVRFRDIAGPPAGSSSGNYEYSLSFVPEPSTLALAALGALGLLVTARRQRS